MRIGVIDIGSNTIKLLVAETGSTLAVHYETTWETRIGTSLGLKDQPFLGKSVIKRACDTVKSLIAEAGAYHVDRFVVAATSAVRDAGNSDEFMDAIHAATGQRLQLLSGEEEAAYIGFGVATDPVLSQYDEFCLADLGGGSLELIHFKHRELIAKTSLPLGAIRLSKQLLEDPRQPMESSEMRRIVRRVRKTIDESGFRFPSESKVLAGTGGGLAVARAIRASWLGQRPEEASNALSLAYLRFLYIELAAMPLEERTRIPALPPERADIMPTALIVLLTVAEMANAASFIFSERNLRYGIAARYYADHANDTPIKLMKPNAERRQEKHASLTKAQEIAPGK